MQSIIDELKNDMRHAEMVCESCVEDGKLHHYYHGKVVAYRHAIKRLQDAINQEAKQCNKSES